jgi:hypothetical protein
LKKKTVEDDFIKSYKKITILISLGASSDVIAQQRVVLKRLMDELRNKFTNFTNNSDERKEKETIEIKLVDISLDALTKVNDTQFQVIFPNPQVQVPIP